MIRYFDKDSQEWIEDRAGSESWNDREAELWRQLWRLPQARAWKQPQLKYLHYQIASYVRECVVCESPSAKAADVAVKIRLEDRIGLSEAGLQALGWKISEDNVDMAAHEVPGLGRGGVRERHGHQDRPVPTTPEGVTWPTTGSSTSRPSPTCRTPGCGRHVRQPDGILRGKPFCWSDWQFWYAAHRWRVREDAEFVPPEEVTVDNPLVLNQAFQYRLTGCIGPQKTGKGPTEASCAISSLRPRRVCRMGEARRRVPLLRQRLPRAGWVYHYNPGEPKGMRHPDRPPIQLTANSEDQVRNAYRPLVAMIRLGPLKRLLKVREGFIRILPAPGINLGRRRSRPRPHRRGHRLGHFSRLGNPISDAEQDEAGLYTKSNGHARSWPTPNAVAPPAWAVAHALLELQRLSDPGENSYAQQQFETSASDVWIFYRNPDLNPDLRHKDGTPYSFNNRRERRRILEWVYAGSPWVPLDSVEAEAEALMEKDPRRPNASSATEWCRAVEHGSMMDSGRAAMQEHELWL